jgi:hypothetical protein
MVANKNCASGKELILRQCAVKPLGRPRNRWDDNIELDLREVGYEDVR